MTFPINRFRDLEIEQIVDVIAPPERLKRVKRQGNKKPYWLISLTTVPLEYAAGMELAAYIDSQLGAINNFLLPNPQPSIVSRTGIFVSSDVAEGQTQIPLSGLTPNQQSAVAAGDFINFNGSAKTYRMVSTETASVSGNLTAKVTPPLVEPVTAGTLVNYGVNAMFQVSLRDKFQANISVGKSKRLVFDIELIEQI